MSGGGQASAKGKAVTVSEGYVNLGAVAGMNQERDTSSCASISVIRYLHLGASSPSSVNYER